MRIPTVKKLNWELLDEKIQRYLKQNNLDKKYEILPFRPDPNIDDYYFVTMFVLDASGTKREKIAGCPVSFFNGKLLMQTDESGPLTPISQVEVLVEKLIEGINRYEARYPH